MFSKATKASEPAASAPAPARKPVVASLVAEGVTMRGDFAAEGDLHLDGALEGDVKVERLTIGETGSVAGAIEAESVEVRGRVAGTISARQVRLCATARVDGDIRHAELSIEAGAHFEGRSLVFEIPATAEPLALAAAE